LWWFCRKFVVWVAAACFIAKEMLCAGCENSWLLAGNLVRVFDCCGNFACGVCYLLSSVLLLGKYVVVGLLLWKFCVRCVLFVVVCFIAGEICCRLLIAVEILRAVCVICCRLFYCWGNILA
jgi:hypothetical protein